MTCVRRTTCRICDGDNLHSILNLGRQPLANAFLDPDADLNAEPRYPLELFYCDSCSLVQLLDVVDPEVLFRNYIYVSGTSDGMRGHFDAYAAEVTAERGLTADSTVLEVASNDGTLLKGFQRRGIGVIGIEPATNVAQRANDEGVATINEFFTQQVVDELLLEKGPVDAVVGNNVLAHVDGSVPFLRAAAVAIKAGGVVVVEVPYVVDMLDGLEYDTVYHEHLCYFSVTALDHLFRRAGLAIYRIDRTPVHGGSIRVWAMKTAAKSGRDVVEAYLEQERECGLVGLERYQQFARRVEDNRVAILDLLKGLRRDGFSLGAYGAPAKGNTLLNFCGIGTDLVPFTVDRSLLKVGKLTPGMHLPVLPAEALVERAPDFALILAWNFADEIMEQQAAYRRGGGRFIVPVPVPRAVEYVQ